MSNRNDCKNECGNQVTSYNYPDEYEQSFYEISQKIEPSSFMEYFDSLSKQHNILNFDKITLEDDINHSNICYWKNKRKVPKFLHDHYLLGDTIGKGSYGKVKDCIDIRTIKRYAIKIVCRMKIKKIPGGMRHVESEIAIMKLLSHKNIVKLVDDFQEIDPERRCLVMEFCLGSIHDLQTNGIMESSNQFRFLPEWQAHAYFVQIIAGVQYLHNLRLIHKDLKPGNFLLTEHEVVKITDFGVSEKLDLFQQNSFISGGQTTPAIQPPELAIGAPNICGYKLDIYGTGVSLYFMLCGRVPFSNPNILLIFDEIASGEYSIPETVSPHATELIRMMMCKDVDTRYDIAKVRNHDWYHYPGEKNGAKVDPKFYLNYAIRDSSKENLYRLSTAITGNVDSNEKELPAIMPLTVTSRLRTHYNWPMTEEEKAMVDEQIIADDFISMDNKYASMPDNTFHQHIVDHHASLPVQHGIRFFIQTDEKNDNNCPTFFDPHFAEADSQPNYPMSMSLSHSAFGQRDSFERDNISRNTIPLAATSSRINSTNNASGVLNKESKISFRSKLKFGRRLSRCTQS